MASRTKIREKVDSLALEVTGYEVLAKAVFEDAQYAAALIPPQEFEEVFVTAPEMEYHHRYVQSILTWVWYEVNENGVRLEHLPDMLRSFYEVYEAPFAKYWF